MKPLLLLTNDDGIHAPGIFHLWNILKNDFELIVVAPASEKSGCSLSTTIHSPLLFGQVKWGNDQQKAWSVQGTPADCVKLALRVLSKIKPTMVLSGINTGANSGRTVYYSGTVAGVMEAALRDVPGIAFSSQSFTNPRFEEYTPYIPTIVKHFLKHPIPKGSFLNVNFPSDYPEAPKGLVMARQGKGYWQEHLHERIHPEGHPYYWLSGQWKIYDEEKDSDVALLKEGLITIVPLHVNDMTDQSLLNFHRPLVDQLSCQNIPSVNTNFNGS